MAGAEGPPTTPQPTPSSPRKDGGGDGSGMRRTLRVVEFYSGVGGARLGLEKWAARAGEGGAEFVTAAAYDMNAQANTVYELNFGLKVRSRAIEHVKPEELSKLAADVWLMSPPCQPFTQGGGRGGKKGGGDTRCASFHHLVQTLASPKLAKPPAYILLENVVNFGSSEPCTNFIAVLREKGYAVRCVTASPDWLRSDPVPYYRPRFYVLAARVDNAAAAAAAAGHPSSPLADDAACEAAVRRLFSQPSAGSPPPATPALDAFFAARGLERPAAAAAAALAVPTRWFPAHPTYRYDCVSGTRAGHVVSCITKGYGQSHRSGSVIVEDADCPADAEEAAPDAKRARVEPDAEVAAAGAAPSDDGRRANSSVRIVSTEFMPKAAAEGESGGSGGGLRCPRFVSPAEAHALHGFPVDFRYPAEYTDVSKWKLIGNSLSCDVHAALCELLF
eukprot:Rhum_TRINITY_DN12218_c0_g1::Rhum_TRINITY_DN12218_c0_g1_i1::g.50160::m.50160/K15336/TRDMT1, DNMT2; tRNA (cytosine38-C5)-methyltransferase